MQPEQQAEINWRLRTAEGHLRAVSAQIEAGEPCEQVLHQLGAVQAALRVVEARLLICQLEQSKEIIRRCSSAEDRAAEIERLLGLYALWIKHSDRDPEVTL